MAARQLSDKRADGLYVGQSATDKVGFYGTAPVVQASVITAVNTTASTSTTNAFGFTTSTQADAIVTALNSVITALKNIGIVASA